ncbi:hypothetical protein GCM10009579_62000 [Streptomyces javensis]|uniref:Uncharacterized protein n=1 Tax=Streptomyces javensis TaxID=114698 RepID=A0ABP4HUW4_9ACTN
MVRGRHETREAGFTVRNPRGGIPARDKTCGRRTKPARWAPFGGIVRIRCWRSLSGLPDLRASQPGHLEDALRGTYVLCSERLSGRAPSLAPQAVIYVTPGPHERLAPFGNFFLFSEFGGARLRPGTRAPWLRREGLAR